MVEVTVLHQDHGGGHGPPQRFFLLDVSVSAIRVVSLMRQSSPTCSATMKTFI